MNILDLLISHAAEYPTKPAYIYLEDGEAKEISLSYRQLRTIAQCIGSNLATHQERACILLFPSGIEFLEAFWGCLWANKMAVPVSFPVKKRGFEPLARIIEDVGDVVILTNKGSYQKLEQWFGSDAAFNQVKWLFIEDLKEAKQELNPIKRQGSDIAILQYTSGSTGHPKGVMVTYDNVMDNSLYIQNTFSLNINTVGVTWLPHFHDMGLIDGFVVPIVTGFTRVFMSPIHFLQKPVRWLAAITKYRAHYSGAPNFAYDLCAARVTAEQLEAIDLTDLAYLYNGAEAIHAHTLVNFSKRFGKLGYQPEKMVTCYGMAETTLAICFSPRGYQPATIALDRQHYKNGVAVAKSDSDLIKVSSGVAPHEVQLKLVDPNTFEELREMQIGEIWVRSQSVAQGYWEKEKETAEVFHSQLNGDSEQYLRTGDMGFLSDGELFITGRHKDLIIYHGVNYFPNDLETSIAHLPGLKGMNRAAFSIDNGNDEAVVILVEIQRTYIRDLKLDSLIASIKHEIFTGFSLPVADIVCVKPGSLPKSTSGKIQRAKCKKQYLTDVLNKLDAK